MTFRFQMLYRAAFVMILALVGSSPAAAAGYAGGVPWQTGDIVACSGAGTCSVLRIVIVGGVPTPMLLDQFSDGLLGSNTGVAINNTLHVVTTDDAGGGSSKVFVSPIASLNPNTSPASPVPHTPPVYTYDGSAGNSSQVKTVAYNNAGNIFVLNSVGPGGSPEIVELGPGPGQTPAATFSLFSCVGVARATSMDLSAAHDANGNSLYAYVTSGGTIQQIKFSDGSCTKFADFGTGVTLYGIKDIPSGALASVGTCKGSACPSDESLLVVATGFTDPDAAEGTELSSDPDAYNICTNAQDQNPVSCALLIDTDPTKATLSAPLWTAGRVYPGVGNLTTILDPQLKLQSVFTAGTSGADEPKFDENGGTVIDNAVKWTDIQQPGWLMNHAYAKGALPAHTVAAVSDTFFVDPNGNLETVTTPGTSGPVEPGAVGNPVSWSASPLVPTIDGLQWQDKGGWLAGHLYSTLGQPVGDRSFHIHKVLTGGTAGLGPSTPTGGWNEGGITIDNAVIWTNQGAFSAYAASTVFGLGAYTAPNNTRVQQAIQPGKSGSSTLFVTSTGTKTEDGGVTWTDQGQRPWHPSFAFTSSAVIVDAAGHLQQVTTAGT